MVKSIRANVLTIVLLLLTLFIVDNGLVAANTIESIDVQVQLQSDGSAQFTETWKADVDEGTELYKPIELTSEQTITDYQVSVNGTAMQKVASWDVDADFDSKAYQYGQGSDELNWGISEYGENTYEITYTVTNFVAQTQSYQMIYWQFINDSMSPAPESVRVEIASELGDITAEDHRVWGFGYNGDISFTKQGTVLAESQGDFNEGNYVTILLRLPDQAYSTRFHLDNDFDHYVKQSFAGSNYNWEDYDPDASQEDLQKMDVETDPMSNFEIGVIGAFILAGLASVVVSLRLGIKLWQQRRRMKRVYPKLENLSNEFEGEYYRDQPFETVFDSYVSLVVLSNHNMSEETEEASEGMWTASLLWLIKAGYLRPLGEAEQDKGQFQIVNKEAELDEPIAMFYDILVKAADKEGYIEEKRFKAYLKSHSSDFTRYIKKIKATSEEYMLAQGYQEEHLTAKKKSDMTDLDKANEEAAFPLTQTGLEKRNQLVKFHNYLKDYSLLNERSAKEVVLWDELMLYAAALGILDEVEAEFAKLYPDYRTESVYSGGSGDFTFTQYYLFSRAINTYYRELNRPKPSSPSSSSGAGGFSSLGGGGGSFGGGSGGGIR
ncbi:DUF2207 family protein [Aerococcus kribbianus]|uniref:DUF2207 domain-containing protein n=1 Tax=Aerococcus kribbianus TaxID=2999064 RepID=A0A9X3JGA9_9LACT|nr:DUF2207 domain-containing protein [Aerococcus sp. YH-aer222]MCZ0725339.1 DUF2207 domain-containing protein [Aerococcus sp. YH-aer222]